MALINMTHTYATHIYNEVICKEMVEKEEEYTILSFSFNIVLELFSFILISNDFSVRVDLSENANKIDKLPLNVTSMSCMGINKSKQKGKA